MKGEKKPSQQFWYNDENAPPDPGELGYDPEPPPPQASPPSAQATAPHSANPPKLKESERALVLQWVGRAWVERGGDPTQLYREAVALLRVLQGHGVIG